jgi:hypothetical protein
MALFMVTSHQVNHRFPDIHATEISITIVIRNKYTKLQNVKLYLVIILNQPADSLREELYITLFQSGYYNEADVFLLDMEKDYYIYW